MGNDLADAIRDELREELIRAYGTLEAAAEAVGIPYKTLYRALTTRGKDRSQSVKLDLVMDVADHLATLRKTDFTTIYARAQERRNAASVPTSVEDAPVLTRAEERALRQSEHALAAKRGRNDADVPHAE